jgi:hypothetical protein
MIQRGEFRTIVDSLITQRAIRRSSFRNVRELAKNIDEFVTHYNAHNRPRMDRNRGLDHC